MVKDSALPDPQELQEFIPGDGLNGKKYQIVQKKDTENGVTAEYDPFRDRKIEHPVSDNETLAHLLKASLGTGILSMPYAFKYTGLVSGIFITIITAFVCTHCSYVLVKCAHTLYKRTRQNKMNFAEVAEAAFSNGPDWGKKFTPVAKPLINLNLFVTYFGTCSVYTVIIAANFQEIWKNYLPDNPIELRIIIAALLVPIILLTFVPNLKYLAPFSMVANAFMGVGLLITFYYLCTDMPPLSKSEMSNSVIHFPPAIAIIIFAMEAIGVVMPLENQMKTPRNFVGGCGVLNRGMSAVTMVYILLGFLGYARYGELTNATITVNLPLEDYAAQAVKVLIALAVFCTFGLQFFVCIEIAWDAIKDKFTTRPRVANQVMRVVMAILAVLLAVAVPTIGPFVGLIGAFCFSILGLLIPVFIETVTYWEDGFGKFNWMVVKNVFIVCFGILALIFGSKSSIEDIIKMYL